MAFSPKTDWQYDEIVTENDLNRIEQGIADATAVGAATDAVIGSRTATDSVSPSFTGQLTPLISSLFTLVKGVTGKPSALTPPAITLETVSGYLDQSVKIGASPTFAGLTLSAPLPIGSGGTGSATKNFMDLTTTQTIGGIKTFSLGMNTGDINTTGFLKLVAPSGTNPNKYLRSDSGNLQILNSAFTTVLLGISDAGALTTRSGNTLDNGSGAAMFAGDVRIASNKQISFDVNSGSANAFIGSLTSPAGARFGLSIAGYSLLTADATTKGAYTLNNVLDNGSGAATFAGGIAADSFTLAANKSLVFGGGALMLYEIASTRMHLRGGPAGFNFVNNANSAYTASLDNSGNLTTTGSITTNSTLSVGGAIVAGIDNVTQHYLNGNVQITGNYAATGTKSAIVPTINFDDQLLYALESPENRFEDFYEVTLDSEGFATIEMDPIFLETVEIYGDDYQVQITGTVRGTYGVTERNVTNFIIEGEPNATVMCRVTAWRYGYKDLRFNWASI